MYFPQISFEPILHPINSNHNQSYPNHISSYPNHIQSSHKYILKSHITYTRFASFTWKGVMSPLPDSHDDPLLLKRGTIFRFLSFWWRVPNGTLGRLLETIRRRCLHSMFECFFDSQKLSIFAVYAYDLYTYVSECTVCICFF